MVDALDAYLARSLATERSLVTYEQELAAVTAGTRPDLGNDDPEARAAAEHLANHARAEMQRCLQARALCRRMRDRSLAEIVLALCQAGLCDHGAVLVTGDWEGGS
jgi:hypothetical protein